MGIQRIVFELEVVDVVRADAGFDDARSVKRGGKIWIRVFPDKPATKKPAETRMGSGKGAPDHWVAVVKPGRILFEMAGVDHESAVEAMRLASHKLPVQTRVVVREGAKEA